MKTMLTTAALTVLIASTPLAQARKDTLDGVRNFTVVDATASCSGATAASAIPAIAAKGYKSIVNLRLDTEAGAAIAESRAAAEKAGIRFVHLPFDNAAPDMAVVDAFIKAVTDKANQPVFINCASANRASALWLAKRILADKWDEKKALDEAHFIGLTNPASEKFALDYVAARRK